MRSRTARVTMTLMRNGSRPSIGKPAMCHARKERVLLVGTDQRITSGPAAITAAFKGRIHGCTRTLRKTSDSPLAPRAPSIHGTSGTLARLWTRSAIRGISDISHGRRMRANGGRLETSIARDTGAEAPVGARFTERPYPKRSTAPAANSRLRDNQALCASPMRTTASPVASSEVATIRNPHMIRCSMFFHH